MIHSKTTEEIKEEIKYLCNFSEKKISDSGVNISYLDYVNEDIINEQLKAKSVNRELAIDIMTGEKQESAWGSRIDLPKIDDNHIPTMGLKIFSMNIQGKPFTSYEDLHTLLINYMESFTQGQPILSNANATGITYFDLTLTNDPDKTSEENFSYHRRRIISKLVSCGNYIATTNRRGPGTTLLAHPETILKYFNGDKQSARVQSYTLIESELISKDKFIVLRADLKGGSEDGLFVIKSIDKDQYFMKETPSLKDRIMWFYIN
jgi:hypothetical protein